MNEYIIPVTTVIHGEIVIEADTHAQAVSRADWLIGERVDECLCNDDFEVFSTETETKRGAA